MLGLMDDRYQVAVKRVLRHEFHGIKAALSLMLANRLQHKNVLPYLVSGDARWRRLVEVVPPLCAETSVVTNYQHTDKSRKKV